MINVFKVGAQSWKLQEKESNFILLTSKLWKVPVWQMFRLHFIIILFHNIKQFILRVHTHKNLCRINAFWKHWLWYSFLWNKYYLSLHINLNQTYFHGDKYLKVRFWKYLAEEKVRMCVACSRHSLQYWDTGLWQTSHLSFTGPSLHGRNFSI